MRKQWAPFGLTWPLIAIVLISGLLLGIIAGLIFGSKIPDNPPAPVEATIIYDCNEEVIDRLFQENRIPVEFDQIPQMMKNAIIAIEDPDFYKHHGIKVKAIVRAMWVNLIAWDFVQGGSTITQQYAKVSLLTHKKTITRKVKEWIYAINLERNLSKDEILERYLNYICFGNGVYGIEAAAQLYFDKHIWELELHQFALLAGIIRSPENYSPFKYPEVAQKRRAIVLNKMEEFKFITPEEADRAKKAPLDVAGKKSRRRKAPFFVDHIIQELTLKNKILDEEDLYTRGYRIYTTLDLRMQNIAEEAIADLPASEPDKNNVIQPQIALVALDPTNGYIKAMIGGRDWQTTQLNRATKAYRQPGSCMKPFVYTTAIDSHKFTPSTIVVDEAIEYPNGDAEPWIPRNFSKTFQGPVQLRSALERSLNTISVKLVDQLGVSTVFKTAQKMGLTSLISTGEFNDMALSPLALGGLTKGVTPLELTAAYTPLANKGIYSEPMAILKVTDSQGRILLENTPKRKVVLRESVAYLVTDMLKGVIERGTGRRAQIGRPAAGKTGTTDEDTNAWFVGYTPNLMAGVWIGNDSQAQPLIINGTKITSGNAAQIWGNFTRRALENKPITDFVPPTTGITFDTKICSETGFLATPYCTEPTVELFITGTEPTESCPIHFAPDLGSKISLQICLDSGALATDFCPPERVITKTYWAVTGTEINDNTPMPTENCQFHGKSEDEIVVDVCTESGLLATPFCPSECIETISFTPGEEPTLPCNIHSGRNRRMR